MRKILHESLQEFLNEEEVIKGQVDVGITAEDVDPKEFLVGIEVEKEHSKDLSVAKTIALQHLAENPKYYSEGMKKGIFDEVAAINIYKKYFIDKEEITESINENLKDELISKLLDTVYISDNPKQYDLNHKYLELLSEEELDKQLANYYMFDIKRKKENNL